MGFLVFSEDKAKASLVLGIISFLGVSVQLLGFFFLPLGLIGAFTDLPLLFASVIGIVLGYYAIKDGVIGLRWAAVFGIILCIPFLLFQVIFFIFGILYIIGS
jgi:hypothetical protein